MIPSLADTFCVIDNTPLRVTMGMRLLWEMSPKLQEKFSFESSISLVEYCVHCIDVAKKELPFLPVPETDEEERYLHSLDSEEVYAVTPFLRGLQVTRGFLATLDLGSPQGRLKLWRYVFTQTSLIDTNRYYAEAALKQAPVPGNENITVPLILCPFLLERQDVVSAHTAEQDIIQWFQSNGARELEDFDIVERFLSGNTDKKGEMPRRSYSGKEFADPGILRPGINILGYGFGELGIGEDARCALLNAIEGGISASLYNIPLRVESRSKNLTYRSFVDETLPHQNSLYCLPASEFAKVLFTLPEQSRRGRRQILAPPWELPRWPEPMKRVLDYVDELWAPSRFIAAALREATTRPVYHVPLSVSLPESSGKTRADFGLPEDVFLFLFIFDWLSWPNRKNPSAVIKAFLRAFPRNREVGLVIKTMNIRNNLEKLYSVLGRDSDDSRIYILDETLDASDITALYQSVDAYVSLHRSEGFGRTMAEAMLAGIPVIATDFSGNTDFCDDETAYLVEGSIVKLKEGDYLFPEGQYWCDPDIDQASEQMRFCYENGVVREQKINKARSFIQKNHSAKNIGKLYVQRLEG